MTRYKLLIELPDYKAGSIFEKDAELKYGWQLVRKDSGVDEDGFKWSSGYAESIGKNMGSWLDLYQDIRTILEPVEETPKWEVRSLGDYSISVSWDTDRQPPSDTERLAISEAIRSLLTLCYTPIRISDVDDLPEQDALLKAIDKARKLVKEQK